MKVGTLDPVADFQALLAKKKFSFGEGELKMAGFFGVPVKPFRSSSVHATSERV